MTGSAVTGFIVLYAIPVFITYNQGRAKNRSGLVYGLFLSWLGVIILAFLPPLSDLRYRECPHCREDVRMDASVCPHCRREVSPGLTVGEPHA